jgi:hypothetical protein
VAGKSYFHLLLVVAGSWHIGLSPFHNRTKTCGSRTTLCIFSDNTNPLLREGATLELLTKDCITEEYSFLHDLTQQVVYKMMIPQDDQVQLIKAEDLERSVYVLTTRFFFCQAASDRTKRAMSVAQLCRVHNDMLVRSLLSLMFMA